MVVRQFFMIIQFRLAYLIKGECSEHSTNPKENQILFRSSMNKTGGVIRTAEHIKGYCQFFKETRQYRFIDMHLN